VLPLSRRPLWLSLGEVRDALIARGFSATDAEPEIMRAVKDGVLPGATGDSARLRIDNNDNPWFSGSWGRWGWGWLRESPMLDFCASTILVPAPAPQPGPRSITEETFRMLAPQRGVDLIWRAVRIEIATSDVDWLWPRAVPTEEIPQKSRTGRPSASFWDEAHVFAREWLEDRGFPAPGDGNQAELERQVTAFLADRDHHPAEGTVRRHVVNWITEYRAAVGA
jgi:hypothetical protein